MMILTLRSNQIQIKKPLTLKSPLMIQKLKLHLRKLNFLKNLITKMKVQISIMTSMVTIIKLLGTIRSQITVPLNLERDFLISGIHIIQCWLILIGHKL